MRMNIERMPTPRAGVNPWKGKKNPVALVATVVTRKSSVHPLIPFAVISPNKTTSPDTMPMRLKRTCIAVKVLIPSTIVAAPFERMVTVFVTP
jgi:hypothetical protein